MEKFGQKNKRWQSMVEEKEEERNRLNDNKGNNTFHSRNIGLKQYSLVPVNRSRILSKKNF